MDKQSKKDLAAQYKTRVSVGGVYAIRCTGSQQVWLRKTTDMQGAKNRHAFSISTRSCPEPSMLEAWKAYGPEAFSFEVLETLEKKESDTSAEFTEEIGCLLSMWQEKLS